MNDNALEVLGWIAFLGAAASAWMLLFMDGEMFRAIAGIGLVLSLLGVVVCGLLESAKSNPY
jgi:hypothetical protein